VNGYASKDVSIIRILQVIPLFNPSKPFGGSQAVVKSISEELVKRGHEVVVLTSDLKTLSKRSEPFCSVYNGIEIIRMRCISTALASNIRFVITPELFEFLKTSHKDFDAIHLHEARGYQHFLMWFFSSIQGTPYILQPHGNLSTHFGGIIRMIYDRLLGRRILLKASAIIALNEIELNQVIRYGVPKSRIITIPNGIDLHQFDSIESGRFKKKFGLDSSSVIILYLGRIHPIKGIDKLIRAFAIVVNSIPNSILVLAGPDEGYLPYCMNKARELGIENNVSYVGPLYNITKMEAYRESSVYVLPSLYDTFPVSLLEAYASGTPVVAFSVGGLKELIIQGETGVLVQNDTSTELAKAIIYTLEQSEDLGMNAREYVKEYDIRKTVDLLEKAYLNLRSG
jgi:glycosyltransferase involved in cell wall biosynthesis